MSPSGLLFDLPQHYLTRRMSTFSFSSASSSTASAYSSSNRMPAGTTYNAQPASIAALPSFAHSLSSFPTMTSVTSDMVHYGTHARTKQVSEAKVSRALLWPLSDATHARASAEHCTAERETKARRLPSLVSGKSCAAHGPTSWNADHLCSLRHLKSPMMMMTKRSLFPGEKQRPV